MYFSSTVGEENLARATNV